MNVDHTFLHINNFGAATGFGLAMGIALIPALLLAGMRPSKFTFALLVATVALVCICLALWAQNLRLDHVNLDAIKAIAWTAAGIVATIIVGRSIQSIVERAPPTALVVIFSILAGCVLCAGLVLFAPYHNLLLILFIVLILALTVAVTVLAWATDRRHARENDHRVYLPREPQAPSLPRTRRDGYLPREERRGRLPYYPPETYAPAPDKPPQGNLPAVVKAKPVEWMS